MAPAPWTRLLLPLLLAGLPPLRAQPPRASLAQGGGWEEAPQRNTLLDHVVGVPSEELQAGTEPGCREALEDPTTWPPPFPEDEAGGLQETVPDGRKGPAGPPGSLEGEQPEEEGCREGALPGSLAQVASAVRALGVELLQEIEAEDGGGNTLFSPLSISLALAQLALGAANQTKERLLGALHLDSVPCLHQALRGLTRHLRRTTLRIAGRLFLDKGLAVKAAFLEASRRFYGAQPALLSGDARADLAAINGWVEEATEGQISRMLSRLPPNALMVLLNAICFRGFWRTRFDPLLTEPGLFHLGEGRAVSVPMMAEPDFPLSWFRLEPWGAEVARLPFEGNSSLLAVVPGLPPPGSNASQLLSQLLRLDLQAAFPRERPTSLRVPRLHLEGHTDLRPALTRLGLGELFSAPDLSPIAEGPLVVSSVQHRAALELTEAGVQAAAATSVIAFRSSEAFFLDQPFIFVIMDDVTGVPLFLGSVRDPSLGAPREKAAQDTLREKHDPPADHTLDPWKP